MKVAQREEADNCPHGTLVLAECQSQGVGRGGRDWVSQPNVRNTYCHQILTLVTIGKSLFQHRIATSCVYRPLQTQLFDLSRRLYELRRRR